MCRKLKDVKEEELNRLKEKYSYVLNGRLEMNIQKTSNFVNIVLPVLVLQFLEQDNLRYNCNFENCKKANKSYASKFGYIQHLCLNHSNQLPGGGLFLLQKQEKTLEKLRQKNSRKEFKCKHCERIYKRKSPYLKHEQSCSQNKSNEENVNAEIITLEESFATIVLD